MERGLLAADSFCLYFLETLVCLKLPYFTRVSQISSACRCKSGGTTVPTTGVSGDGAGRWRDATSSWWPVEDPPKIPIPSSNGCSTAVYKVGREMREVGREGRRSLGLHTRFGGMLEAASAADAAGGGGGLAGLSIYRAAPEQATWQRHEPSLGKNANEGFP